MADRPTYVWSGSEWDAVADPGAVRKALVNAKGDLVTATANDTPAVLTVGANDTVLTADSSTATGLAWKAASSLPSQTSQAGKFLTTNGTTASWVDPPTNRNLIINGAMNVHQRGTSVASVPDGYNTADRWRVDKNAGTWTQSVENDAPTGSGFRKSLKMLCTTAKAVLSAGDYATCETALEGQDVQRIKKGTASAEQLSLSFWVKANATGTYVVELRDNDNSRQVAAAYTVSASATWEKKTITFPADTTGVLDNDNASSLRPIFWLLAGSAYSSGTLSATWESGTNANRAVGQTNLAASTNNYWQVTGVQLETGPVATPFEFEPYEATLRKCQRYYQRIVPGAAGRYFGQGQSYSTTQTEVVIPFKTVMRTNPTALEQSGTAADYRVGTASGSSTSLSAVASIVNATDNSITVLATVASGQVAGNAAPVLAWSTTAYLGWSAEL